MLAFFWCSLLVASALAEPWAGNGQYTPPPDGVFGGRLVEVIDCSRQSAIEGCGAATANRTLPTGPWCDIFDAIAAERIPLSQALAGQTIEVGLLPLQDDSPWSATTYKFEGMVGELLEQLAAEGKFQYRVLILSPPKSGDAFGGSWTQWAAEWTRRTDLIAAWAFDTPGRRAKGVDFPLNFIDLSPVVMVHERIHIMSGGASSKSQRTELTLDHWFDFPFMKPFKADMWVAIFFILVFVGVVLGIVEGNLYHTVDGEIIWQTVRAHENDKLTAKDKALLEITQRGNMPVLGSNETGEDAAPLATSTNGGSSHISSMSTQVSAEFMHLMAQFKRKQTDTTGGRSSVCVDVLRELGYSIYQAASALTSGGGFAASMQPHTFGGRLFSVVAEFVFLVIVAWYTANLAAFVISSNRPPVYKKSADSYQQILDEKLPVCVQKLSAISDLIVAAEGDAGSNIASASQRLAKSQLIQVNTGRGIYGDVNESMARVRWYNYYRVPNEDYRRPSQPVGEDPYYCAGTVVPVWFAENTMVMSANYDCTLRKLPRAIINVRGGWMTGSSTGKTWIAHPNATDFGRNRKLCAEVLTDALGLMLTKMQNDNVISRLRSAQLQRIAASTPSQCNQDGSPQAALLDQGFAEIWRLGKQMNITSRGPREQKGGAVDPFPSAFNTEKRNRRQLPGQWEGDLPDLGSASHLKVLTDSELADYSALTPLPPTTDASSSFWSSDVDASSSFWSSDAEPLQRGVRRRLAAAAAGGVVAASSSDSLDDTPISLLNSLGIITLLLIFFCVSFVLSPSFYALIIRPLKRVLRKCGVLSISHKATREKTRKVTKIVESMVTTASELTKPEVQRSSPAVHHASPDISAPLVQSIHDQVAVLSHQVDTLTEAMKTHHQQVDELTRVMKTQQQVLEEVLRKMNVA